MASVLCHTNFLENARTFASWLHTHALKCESCSVADFPETGRGVAASRNISPGDVVVEVPDDMVLLPENCRISQELEVAGLVNAPGNAAQEVLGLILAVMVEKHWARESKWGPYLDFLPEALPGLPMFWDEPDLARLAGTSVLTRMQDSGRNAGRFVEPPTCVEKHWKEVVRPFLRANPQCGIQGSSKGRRLYMWATAIVSAYSFTLGDDKLQGMVPYWDMLNHITGKANVRLYHDSHRGVLQMIATQPIPRGAQVVNTYGDLPNSELLRRFGFVETDPNPHDCAELQVPDLALAAARLYACEEANDSATGLSAHLEADDCPTALGIAPKGRPRSRDNMQEGREETHMPVPSPKRSVDDVCAIAQTVAIRPGPSEAYCDLPAAGDSEHPGKNRKRKLGKTLAGTAKGPGRDSNTDMRPHLPGCKGLTHTAASSPAGTKVAQSPADIAVSARIRFAEHYGIIRGGGAMAVAAENGSRDREAGRQVRDLGQSFVIPCIGVSTPELLECTRLLALAPTAFRRFRRSVEAWRCPLAKPLAQRRPEEAPERMRAILNGAVDVALGRYPSVPPLRIGGGHVTRVALPSGHSHAEHAEVSWNPREEGSDGGEGSLRPMPPSFSEGMEGVGLSEKRKGTASVAWRQQAAEIVVEGEVRCWLALRDWVQAMEPDSVVDICAGVWERALGHRR